MKVVPNVGRDAHAAREEVKILRAVCAHPFIVSLHYAFDDATHTHLALTYAGGGDLLQRLEASASGALAESTALLVFAQVKRLLLLSHLHLPAHPL